MPRQTHHKGQVLLTLAFQREGSKWVGTCIELSTSTYARTLRQCQASLKALVVEHLNLLEDAGERERFFERWNISFHEAKAKRPEVTIRGVGTDWPQSLHGDLTASGPFYQPQIFSVPETQQRADRDLVGV